MNNRAVYKITMIVAIFLSLPTSLCAGTITLKTGEKIDGAVIEKNEQNVKFDYKGAIIIYRASEIAEIDGKPVSIGSAAGASKPLKGLLESGGVSSSVSRADSVTHEEYLGRGIAYYSKGNLDQAMSDFSRAIKAKPDYGDAYIYRGLVYVSMSMPDEALADYNKAIEINPRNEEAYYVRGLIYSGKKDIDKALIEFDKAVEINPKYVQAYLNRGFINITRGNKDEVLSDANTIIGINPDIAMAYLLRGLVYVTRNNMDQAIADYTKAIELKSDYQEAYINRALAYGYREKVERSKMAPSSPTVYADTSAGAVNKEDFEKAISDCNKAIELNPKYIEAYGVRAKIYLLANQIEKAREDARKVEELGGEVKPEFSEELNKASQKAGSGAGQ